MFTPRTSSSTVTIPSELQSPPQPLPLQVTGGAGSRHSSPLVPETQQTSPLLPALQQISPSSEQHAPAAGDGVGVGEGTGSASAIPIGRSAQKTAAITTPHTTTLTTRV